MTRDDIIRLAREAGICTGNSILLPAPDGQIEALDRFAALVAAAEREACAKVCEKTADNIYSNSHEDSQPMPHAVAKFCATAIRARGET